MDLAVRRQFSLVDNIKLQFSGEFFNVFNHPNFAVPNSNISNTSTVGSITSVSGTPTYQQRTVEFAAKFNF